MKILNSSLFIRYGYRAIAVALLLIAPVVQNAFSHSSRPLPFKSIVDKSGTIVHGIVTKVESGKEDDTGLVCTWTTVKVVEGLKGVEDEKTIVYKQFGGVDKESGIKWLSNTPALRPGWEVLLCLYPSSSLGFTTPIGESQGVFYVKRDPYDGSASLDNGMPQSILFPESEESNERSTKVKTKSVDLDSNELLKKCRSMQLNSVKQAIFDYVAKRKDSVQAMNAFKTKWIEQKAKTKISRQ